MEKRSNVLVVVGLAVFLLGGGIVMLVLRGNDHARSTTPISTAKGVAPGAAAVGAAQPLAAGATATVRRPSIKVPDGKQAVALQLDFVPGVAGYVGTGDQLDIYANVTKGAPGEPVPFTRLLLRNVDVLDVSNQIAPAQPSTGTSSASRPTGTPIVFLLALDANQAEQLIFATTNEALYATLVPKGQPPAATTGHGYANLFQ